MSPLAVEPDHLVVGAQALQQGCDWVEQQLGVRPQAGGKHVAMGTHNALVGLGPRFYLEVIAVDPDGAKPARPRWFDLDEPRMKAALAEGPHLIHWVVRTSAIDAAVRACPNWASSRRWRAAISRGASRSRTTATVPGEASCPRSSSGRTRGIPADRMTDSGLRLTAIAGEHPEPASVRTLLATLGLSDTLKVTYAKSPRLAAMIRTARGVATL